MKRGRPSGSRKLPDEYLVDLVNFLHYWDSRRPGHSLSAICRHIISRGGVKWIDRETGETVTEITDAGILRTRFIEAKSWYLGLKSALGTVNHPRAAEFAVLPVKLGISVRRRGKRETIVLGLPPKRVTRLRIGKKDVHIPE